MVLIKKAKYGKKTNLIIIGAGIGGELIADYIKENPDLNYNIIAFVDDDENKIGKSFLNIPILGPIKDLKFILNQKKADEVLIAMPSVEGEVIRKIANECIDAKIDIEILPSYFEDLRCLEENKAGYEEVRPISIEDFFTRKPVIANLDELKNHFQGKNILITGAAGSIGSELCNQLIKFNINKLIAIDNAETPLHNLILKIKSENEEKFIPVIADIRKKNKIKKIIQEFHPDIVFHSAAYKHVPIMESNPDEAILNNVFGTKNLIDLAEQLKIKEFILISSDKAVNPTSIMGTSKRLTEIMIQNKSNSETKFIAVRFGNVINSQGSVIPLFKEQIKKGGPVTITHPGMTRFFMRTPEAVNLIIQVPILGETGDIFMLDMGEPKRVLEIVEDMIKLNGLEPHRDIKIEFIGARPGEKISEKLFSSEEKIEKTKNDRIFLVKTNSIDENQLQNSLFKLKLFAENGEKEKIIEELKKIILNYNKNE